jgi:hypothetical protein
LPDVWGIGAGDAGRIDRNYGGKNCQNGQQPSQGFSQPFKPICFNLNLPFRGWEMIESFDLIFSEPSIAIPGAIVVGNDRQVCQLKRLLNVPSSNGHKFDAEVAVLAERAPGYNVTLIGVKIVGLGIRTAELMHYYRLSYFYHILIPNLSLLPCGLLNRC